MTVGGSILAAELACEGHTVFHPTGGTHHGRPDRASGFCYLNDPVFAILTFLRSGRRNVLYIDLDAHHGDGVEDAFIEEDRVTTLSVHEAGRWPFSGTHSRPESGAWNFPVPPGLNDSEFEFLFEHAVLPLVEKKAPDALVLCCGADCLAGDPLSKMQLSNIVGTTEWQGVPGPPAGRCGRLPRCHGMRPDRRRRHGRNLVDDAGGRAVPRSRPGRDRIARTGELERKSCL